MCTWPHSPRYLCAHDHTRPAIYVHVTTLAPLFMCTWPHSPRYLCAHDHTRPAIYVYVTPLAPLCIFIGIIWALQVLWPRCSPNSIAACLLPADHLLLRLSVCLSVAIVVLMSSAKDHKTEILMNFFSWFKWTEWNVVTNEQMNGKYLARDCYNKANCLNVKTTVFLCNVVQFGNLLRTFLTNVLRPFSRTSVTETVTLHAHVYWSNIECL